VVTLFSCAVCIVSTIGRLFPSQSDHVTRLNARDAHADLLGSTANQRDVEAAGQPRRMGPQIQDIQSNGRCWGRRWRLSTEPKLDRDVFSARTMIAVIATALGSDYCSFSLFA
jgi:hypothetical protein